MDNLKESIRSIREQHYAVIAAIIVSNPTLPLMILRKEHGWPITRYKLRCNGLESGARLVVVPLRRNGIGARFGGIRMKTWVRGITENGITESWRQMDFRDDNRRLHPLVGYRTVQSPLLRDLIRQHEAC